MFNQLPELQQVDADNKALVGQCILFFLENDAFCKEIKSDFIKGMAETGLLNSFCKVYFNSKYETGDIVPWFMNVVFLDLSYHKNTDKDTFRKFIDKLSNNDAYSLEEMYRITKKYNLNADKIKNDFKEYVRGITDPRDVSVFYFTSFSNHIFYSEIRILGYYYEKLFGEKYNYIHQPHIDRQNHEEETTGK